MDLNMNKKASWQGVMIYFSCRQHPSLPYFLSKARKRIMTKKLMINISNLNWSNSSYIWNEKWEKRILTLSFLVPKSICACISWLSIWIPIVYNSWIYSKEIRHEREILNSRKVLSSSKGRKVTERNEGKRIIIKKRYIKKRKRFIKRSQMQSKTSKRGSIWP